MGRKASCTLKPNRGLLTATCEVIGKLAGIELARCVCTSQQVANGLDSIGNLISSGKSLRF